MDIERVAKKYVEVVKNDIFIKYEKILAKKIISALSGCYQKHEPDIVKTIEEVIKSCRNFSDKSSNPYFELSTNAIFIHGYPKISGVEFDYYGKTTYKELGDIVFIVSVIFNGLKYFEKFTINQFKKAKRTRRTISWDVDKEQLYLLSGFPEFKGVTGSLVPQKYFNLPNYSGCLGSYSFLYEPGDFAFVSATLLDLYLINGMKIKGEDFFLILEKRGTSYINNWHLYWHKLTHIIDFCRHRCGHGCFCFPHPFWDIGNDQFAGNVFDFVDKYLRLCIGEPTEMKIGRINIAARKFLSELLSAIRIKAERDKLNDVLNFINGYSKYKFSDNESDFRNNNIKEDFGGGIGIVHTTINLGE